MKRVSDMLHDNEHFLQEGEIVIYVKDDDMSVMYNDEVGLTEITGKANSKLLKFIDSFKKDLERL